VGIKVAMVKKSSVQEGEFEAGVGEVVGESLVDSSSFEAAVGEKATGPPEDPSPSEAAVGLELVPLNDPSPFALKVGLEEGDSPFPPSFPSFAAHWSSTLKVQGGSTEGTSKTRSYPTAAHSFVPCPL
jgi:hypothetical protein